MSLLLWGDTGNDFETALAALTAYFLPKKNVVFLRYQFRKAAQDPEESVDTFITRLKRLVRHCEYGDMESDMIRDQVVDQCTSKRGPQGGDGVLCQMSPLRNGQCNCR